MRYANIGGAKAAIVNYRGEEHYFLFNGMGMFALEDMFGGKEYLDRVNENSAEGLNTLVAVATVLSEQGELARREIGLDKKKIMSKADWGAPLMLQPRDIYSLRTGCIDAVNLGYMQEVSDGDEEVDLGLVELQKKRKA